MNNPSRAEIRFLEAFERLKSGEPNLLPKGSAVTKNNVAREAGVDPSALRADRFPDVVSAILQWKEANRKEHKSDGEAREATQHRHNKRLRHRIQADALVQRDEALSKLADAELAIVKLTNEIARLRGNEPPSTVTLLEPRNRQNRSNPEKVAAAHAGDNVIGVLNLGGDK